MPAISISQFGGVSPKTPPRYLADTQAQEATNCPIWLGSLSGLLGTLKIRDTDKSNVHTVYRFGQDTQSDSQYWFEFTGDVDVVRGQIAGDVEERTYWTDGIKPKKTNNVLALTGGTAYPIAARDLGVPKPIGALTAFVSGASGETPATYVFTHTWVTDWQEESAPSTNASNSVSVAYGQTVTLSGFPSVPAGNFNLVARRVYAAVQGSSSPEWLFVAEIPAAQNTFTFSLLAETLQPWGANSMTWDAPPDGLKGLRNGPNGIMSAFVGRDLYLCDPYHPYAWPVDYILAIDYPIVAADWIDTTIVVLTTGRPSIYSGTHPSAMAQVFTDVEQACVSKRSVVKIGGDLLYASPDGITRISSSKPSGVVTEALFTREQWQSIKPESIHAYVWENKYVAFYDTGTKQGGFVFDQLSGAFVWHDIYAQAGFNDLQRDALFLVIGNELHGWYRGQVMNYRWRSKKFTFPVPLSFARARVQAEAYPVAIKFYADGLLIHTELASGMESFSVPDTLMKTMEMQVEGNTEVFNIGIATSNEELTNAG